MTPTNDKYDIEGETNKYVIDEETNKAAESESVESFDVCIPNHFWGFQQNVMDQKEKTQINLIGT